MRSYLITGGAGFIGSHLAERLLRGGNKVYSIDNLTTGNISNIDELRRSHPLTFDHLTAGLEEAEKTGRLAELVDMSEVIYHLAAAVGVKLVVEQPIRTLRTNADTTELVLEHASKKGKRVIITSSSEVYGKSAENGGVLREDGDLLLGPSSHSRWCYAVSKLHDEHLALAYHKERKLPVTIVRLFNTVGPKQTGRYGMVVPNFIRAALKNEPITVYGDGEQRRCFTYVGDVVDALIGLAESDKAIGQICNVGSNREISILELANLVKKRLGSSSEIVLVPYKEAYGEGFEDMMRRLPDVTKIKELIGWEAKTPLEDIVDITAEWVRSHDF